VGAEIVHHDDVAWGEGWYQNLLDIGKEHIAVHGAVNDAWSGERVGAQASDKGRVFPMTVRNFSDQSFPARRSAAQSGHVG
jgi:hypothetical protein